MTEENDCEQSEKARLREAYDRIRSAKDEIASIMRERGPERVQNHALVDTDGNPVRLAELFGEQEDLLVVHNMGSGCSHCTMWADGLNGLRRHIERRCALVLCSDDEPGKVGEFAAGRGWGFRCVSGRGSGFAGAMGFRDAKGKPYPGVSAFHLQDDGTIVRTGFAPFGPGDDFCAVWPLFELLRGGAGDFVPR